MNKEELLERYAGLHESIKMFPGYTVKFLAKSIKKLVEEFDARTLLDYGCGKGYQYTVLRLHEQWGNIMPFLYDPGYRPFSFKPTGTYDGVICSDVLEHILEEDIDATLDEILNYANKFVAFSIFTGASRKTFEDGLNLHVTQKPSIWWFEKIDMAVARNNKQHVAIEVQFESEDRHNATAKTESNLSNI